MFNLLPGIDIISFDFTVPIWNKPRVKVTSSAAPKITRNVAWILLVILVAIRSLLVFYNDRFDILGTSRTDPHRGSDRFMVIREFPGDRDSGTMQRPPPGAQRPAVAPPLPPTGGVGGSGRGNECELCKAAWATVRCDRCENQVFCLQCDDIYHR